MSKQSKPQYPTCDHPRLLVQDGVCVLCDQFDGQEDALNLLEDQ